MCPLGLGHSNSFAGNIAAPVMTCFGTGTPVSNLLHAFPGRYFFRQQRIQHATAALLADKTG